MQLVEEVVAGTGFFCSSEIPSSLRYFFPGVPGFQEPPEGSAGTPSDCNTSCRLLFSGGPTPGGGVGPAQPPNFFIKNPKDFFHVEEPCTPDRTLLDQVGPYLLGTSPWEDVPDIGWVGVPP